MNTPHTPGPWQLEPTDGTIRARWSSAFRPEHSNQMGDYLGSIVCGLAQAVGGWPTLGRQFAIPEAEANARLIAASPELLDALTILEKAFVVAVGDTSPFAKEALAPARAAIEKATKP